MVDRKTNTERARELRQRAARARYVILGLSREDDRERLKAYADELDQQAAELEAPTPAPGEPQVTHEQQQVQQQAETPEPKKPDDASSN